MPPRKKTLAKVSPTRRVSKSRLRADAPKSARRVDPSAKHSKRYRVLQSRIQSVQPAQWFRDSVHRGWKNDTQAIEYARRQSEVDYLRESIKTLRKFYRGFTASDGYSLRTREIVRLDSRKHEKIAELAAQIRKELSAQHEIVRPRSTRSKEAVYKHTGAKRSKQRKAFVVHTPDDKTKIAFEYSKDKKTPVRVKEIKKRTGAESKRVYYYFSDYTDSQPRTMEEVIDVTREMIPKMRKGYYVLNSTDYGYIAAPIFRDFLLEELSDRWLAYDVIPGSGQKDNRGVAESLLGFALVSTKLEGAKHEYRERQTRRVLYRKFKARQREAKRARIRRRIR